MLQLVLQLQDCFVCVLAARGTPTATHIQIPCRCAELVAIPFKMLLAQHILTARPLQLAVLFFGFFIRSHLSISYYSIAVTFWISSKFFSLYLLQLIRCQGIYNKSV